jgi:hypothetical protein
MEVAMRPSVDFRKSQRRQAELRSRSEAAVATIWLVFYVLGLAVVVSSPIVSRAIELAAH